MSAEAGVPEEVPLVNVLEDAQESRRRDGPLDTQFRASDPPKGRGQRFVLGDSPARNEETALGRFVLPLTEQNSSVRSANDQIDGHQRREPDNAGKILDAQSFARQWFYRSLSCHVD